MLAAIVTLLAAAAVTSGDSHVIVTPAPILIPAPPAGMAYYIMQGNKIVSSPYTTAVDCTTALTKVKKNLAVAVANTLVCAHRAP